MDANCYLASFGPQDRSLKGLKLPFSTCDSGILGLQHRKSIDFENKFGNI